MNMMKEILMKRKSMMNMEVEMKNMMKVAAELIMTMTMITIQKTEGLEISMNMRQSIITFLFVTTIRKGTKLLS